MDHCYEFAVLRVTPDQRRGEVVNIGLVIFLEGGVDVRLLPSLSKVAALSGQVDLDQLRDLPKVIDAWTESVNTNAEKLAALDDLGVVSVSELGTFSLRALSEYEQAIARLMKRLVAPVPAATRQISAHSRITTTLKAKFRQQKILGADESDIGKHLVVPGYPIDEEEGLFADFVARNGAFHVTETADLRGASSTNLDRARIAGLTAIKLHKAKAKWGKGTQRFVVYAAKSTAGVQQQINLMGDFSDEIFHMSSRQEMARYMDRMMEVASETEHIKSSRSDTSSRQ